MATSTSCNGYLFNDSLFCFYVLMHHAFQVVFAGFSADSLAQRIVDCKPKLVITCNAVKRGVKPIFLKDIVDAALVESEKNGVSVGMHWDLVLVHMSIILSCY